MNRREIEAKLIAKCWKDPAFKEKLKSNPKEALREFEVESAEDFQFEFYEEQPNTWTCVIPAFPADMAELSEEDLFLIAAAWSPVTTPEGGCSQGTFLHSKISCF